MILNFAKGKTEAICNFSGPDHKKPKVKLLVEQKSIIQFQVGPMVKELRFVDLYKHVGTYATTFCGLGTDVVTKAAVMRSETNRLRKTVLYHSSLSPT